MIRDFIEKITRKDQDQQRRSVGFLVIVFFVITAVKKLNSVPSVVERKVILIVSISIYIAQQAKKVHQKFVLVQNQ